MPLHLSPTGLLGRFAPLGFVLHAHILLALLTRISRFMLTKILEEKVCLNQLEML